MVGDGLTKPGARFGILATALAAFVLLGAVAADEAPAQTVSGEGRIVYVKLGDIWVMEADGSNQTNLTNTPDLDESEPAWSPDGSTIVFTRRVDPTAGGFGDIVVMDADPLTNDAVSVTNTDNFDEYQPAWAPSGLQIAFVRQVPGEVISDQPDIFVMDADGENPINLTRSDTNELDPAWSPDGTKIAFAGVREGGWEILAMDPSGMNEEVLTGDGVDAFDRAPDWSPDGTRIVFMKQSQAAGCCEPWEIWAVNSDGSRDTNLTNHPSDDMAPSWSPDGSEIPFFSNRDVSFPDEGDIYVMPAPAVLPPPGGAATTTGARDGRLALLRAREALLAVANLDSAAETTPRRLTTDRVSTDPDWGPDAVPVNTAPTITGVRPVPGSTTRERTPNIGATVADAETNLTKSDLTLFLDGIRIARTKLDYSRRTDRLTYKPKTALSLGTHTARLVARDPEGLVSRRVWSFRIARP